MRDWRFRNCSGALTPAGTVGRTYTGRPGTMSELPRRWSRLLVELPVIVIGVLIALGVDEWRASRADRGLEQDYLVRLEADFEASRSDILATSAEFSRLIAHGRAVASALGGESPFPQDTLGFLASTLQVTRGNYDPAISRGAWDELISTGNLRVLQSEALRYQLSTFYGSVDNLISPVDYSADKLPYRFTVRGILPLELQLRIRESCDDADPLTCPGNSGPGGYQSVVRALMASPSIRPELNVSLQGMAIRSLEAGVTGGFAPVLEQIDGLLQLVVDGRR